MKKKVIEEIVNKENHAISICEDMYNPFCHIHDIHSGQPLYIETIKKLNSKLVVVEFNHKGEHLLSIETIKKLAEISFDENKKNIIQSYQYPNSFLIINKDLVPKLFVLSAIDLRLLKNKNALVGIDGNASSGKTTFSRLLENVYDCNVFHVDNYFQKPVINQDDELSKFASNINFKRMETEIFNPIENQQTSNIRIMDLKTHTLSSSKSILYKPLSIIEGAYSMHPNIIKKYDLKIFLKTTYLKQVIRIWKRNGFKKLIQFIKKWIPMENKYFNDLKIESQSDIILKR